MRFPTEESGAAKLSALALSLAISINAVSAPLLGKDPLHEVVAAMTLAEKIKLVHGTGMNIPGSDSDNGPTVGESDKNRVPGAAGATYAISRLGIPSIVLADGPAGLRIQPLREGDPDNSYYCTAFPIATLLASSWDTELVQRVGMAIGEEVKEYGVDILLAPGMNIQRHPLGGRNFEYYSEDPVLSGKMAAAMVRGVQSNGVGTSIKHYAVNNHEWNRDKINVKVDEKTLREIYLKGFQIAVEEGAPWTVMSSYNKVNGEYSSESYKLLTETLRGEWSFDGFVMTDWFGGSDAEAQIEAGNDLLMPGTRKQAQQLLAASKDHSLDQAALDRSVENILRVVMKTPTFNDYKYSNKPDLKANAAMARMAAAEGMVLLKNHKQALPLTQKSKLALFGNTSYHMITGGTGSGNVNEAYSVSLLDGLNNQGFAPDQPLLAKYSKHVEKELARRPKLEGLEKYMPIAPLPELRLSQAEIERAVKANDVALITLGRSSGEFKDRERADFSLTEAEARLVDAVGRVFKKAKKPVVVVLNIGGPIETVSWRKKVDAIVLAWQPGQEAGNAIADILAGKVTPSGKLPNTFPVTLESLAVDKRFPGVEDNSSDKPSGIMRSRPSTVEYTEGLDVGYRYVNRHAKTAAYPFGFGLSYTTFKYTHVNINDMDASGQISVNVTVKNTGDHPGKEVVQLYASRQKGKRSKYPTRLQAFKKTSLLQPGASETLSLTVTARDLAEYIPALDQWYPAGRYELAIGSSSRDIHKRKVVKLSRTL